MAWNNAHDLNILGKAQQLCWDCKKSVNSGCSWSANFEPVEGWEAVKVERYVATTKEQKRVVNGDVGYAIYNCPEFDPDESVKRRLEELEKEKWLTIKDA